jgi:hypothetical protein
MSGRSDKVRVELHLDPQQYEAIEELRRKQRVIPTRMDAIRDLIDAGLEYEAELDKEVKQAASDKRNFQPTR